MAMGDNEGLSAADKVQSQSTPLVGLEAISSCDAKESIYNPLVHLYSQARNSSYELHGRVMEDTIPCQTLLAAIIY